MVGALPSLEDLRREIDEIDGQLHALLIRRIEVSDRIREAKGGKAAMRPGREAQVLRRLVADHRGTMPKAVLIRLWREIISASLFQQGAFSVAVMADREAMGGGGLGGLARDHFGVLAPIAEQGSAVRVINAVSEGDAGVGVLPLPDADAPDPWWRYLARAGERAPRIVARLPVAAAASPHAHNGLNALVIGLCAPEETGNDRSFLVVEAVEQVSRSAFKDMLIKAGLSVRETALWQEDPAYWLHYAEVEGFLADGDPRVAELIEASSGRLCASWVIGAYPVPFTEKDLAEAPPTA
jgi:chorismate mutase